jgi:RNA polymerase sigma-70 factor, ECF subfamily
LQWSWIAGKSEGAKNAPASSDGELAERLKQRDEHAFLSLYDSHRSAVFRFLMHMTGSVAAAEELTQEVFVVILDAMCAGTVGQFDPQKGTWEGYLLGVARNLARADRRREQRLVSLDSVLETPEWNRQLERIRQKIQPGDVATLVATRSDLRSLYRAIHELPEHYRGALVLCGLEEKSYRDAAAILGCTDGTVASRVNRAKAILAAKLQRSGANRMNLSAIWRGREGRDVGTSIKTNGN